MFQVNLVVKHKKKYKLWENIKLRICEFLEKSERVKESTRESLRVMDSKNLNRGQ